MNSYHKPAKFDQEPFLSIYPTLEAKVVELALNLLENKQDFAMPELKKALYDFNPSYSWIITSNDLGYILRENGFMKYQRKAATATWFLKPNFEVTNV